MSYGGWFQCLRLQLGKNFRIRASVRPRKFAQKPLLHYVGIFILVCSLLLHYDMISKLGQRIFHKHWLLLCLPAGIILDVGPPVPKWFGASIGIIHRLRNGFSKPLITRHSCLLKIYTWYTSNAMISPWIHHCPTDTNSKVTLMNFLYSLSGPTW